MARQIPEEELQAIEDIVRRYPDGVTTEQIERDLESAVPRRTFQYRLKHLVSRSRIIKDGDGRWARYRPKPAEPERVIVGEPTIRPQGEFFVPLSKNALKIQEQMRRPAEARKHVGYNRKFLDAYRPNVTTYLSAKERAHLREVGKPKIVEQPAGTYAKQILNRLLIDLSWNSSRLEGNTYSLLDTKRLIEFGEEAQGKERLEAQMILNHKDAIEFLVNAADDISFNRYTILNLHGMLANNLLADPDAVGRLRKGLFVKSCG